MMVDFNDFDPSLKSVRQVLQHIEQNLEGSEASAYRCNETSIRVGVLWDGFQKMDLLEREELVWPYFERETSEDVSSQITMLLLLPPSQRKVLMEEFNQQN